MNITPYGLPFDRPVARLSRGHRRHPPAVGRRRPGRLRGPRSTASITRCSASRPTATGPREIWTAAHGPRMLELTGRQADGWLPTKMRPELYADGARRRSARRPSTPAATPDALHAGHARLRPAGARRGDAGPHVRAPAGAGPVRDAAAARLRASSASSRRSARAAAFHDYLPVDDRPRPRRSPSSTASRPRSCATTPSAARPSRSPRRSSSTTAPGCAT